MSAFQPDPAHPCHTGTPRPSGDRQGSGPCMRSRDTQTLSFFLQRGPARTSNTALLPFLPQQTCLLPPFKGRLSLGIRSNAAGIQGRQHPAIRAHGGLPALSKGTRGFHLPPGPGAAGGRPFLFQPPPQGRGVPDSRLGAGVGGTEPGDPQHWEVLWLLLRVPDSGKAGRCGAQVQRSWPQEAESLTGPETLSGVEGSPPPCRPILTPSGGSVCTLVTTPKLCHCSAQPGSRGWEGSSPAPHLVQRGGVGRVPLTTLGFQRGRSLGTIHPPLLGSHAPLPLSAHKPPPPGSLPSSQAPSLKRMRPPAPVQPPGVP